MRSTFFFLINYFFICFGHVDSFIPAGSATQILVPTASHLTEKSEHLTRGGVALIVRHSLRVVLNAHLLFFKEKRKQEEKRKEK